MKRRILSALLAIAMVLSLAAPALAVGSNGVAWTLDDGLLTISGEGPMEDYAEGAAPWADEAIYSIVIGDGVTHLGSNAFRGLDKLMDATIGAGVATMGEAVFNDCTALTRVSFLGGHPTIPANTFAGCTAMETFWFQGDLPAFEAYSLATGSKWIDVYYSIDNQTWPFDSPSNLTDAGLGWGPYDIRRGESGSCGENVTWQILYDEMLHSTSDILVISGTGPMDDFTAGEAPWLPYCDRVYTLVITAGVTTIGARAFAGQHFSELYLSGGVSRIGEEAFLGLTNLWSFPLTENLLQIGDRAFAESSIGRVYAPAPSIELGVGLFEDCLDLESVTLVTGTEVIRERMFAGCASLKEVTLPYTVTAVERDAFAGCTGLKTVDYDGIESQWDAIAIAEGNEALQNAKRTTLPVSGDCGDDARWAFDETTATLTISGTGAMKNFVSHIVSRQCPWLPLASQIQCVVVEEGITRIGDGAFSSLYELREVSLPSTLTEMGRNAFSHCERLTAIEFPENLTAIDAYAFFGCGALEEVDLPEKVTAVPDSAFAYCTSLTSLTIHEGVTEIGFEAFMMCDKLSDVQLPAGLTKMNGNVFLGCKSLTHMDWPEGLTYIPGGTFSSSGLTEFVIPETVTSIGGNAFAGCMGLESITIPDSVTSIGERAFESTVSLKAIRIPAGLTAIPSGCFNSSGITEAILPEGVTSIGRYAFSSCPDLQRVVLPETLTSIADEVFTYCSSLKEINWPSGVDTIGWHQFRGTALVEFTVPETVKLVESYAFMNCDKLEKLVFEGKDTVVQGSQIFDNDDLLTIWCWYGSSAQEAAEFESIPYVLFDPPADLPRYPILPVIYGDGSVQLSQEDSTGYEWITFDLVPGPDSVPVGLTLYYYSDRELDLRLEQLDEDSFRFLMPKCPVEIEAVFQNTITGFIDIRSTDFYYEPVLWAFRNNITTGISPLEFGPTAACNRAQVVTFLWRAEGCPKASGTENPFVDVKEGDFFYDAVLWAVEKGITTGISATEFGPAASCNRAQVVTFLHRAKGSPAPAEAELPFTDVPAGEWYAAPVAWALENGITNGVSATEFGPNAVCNRAQVVTFLYRASND